jgi:hypothetical protein
MTEEELEDLQWQLEDFGPAGEYGSRGKKRRKEPIDMTIEEMEAEIEETNEAIRKRRRKNLGLMLKPLWMLTVIACLVGEPVAAFTAYDCSNRLFDTFKGNHYSKILRINIPIVQNTKFLLI